MSQGKAWDASLVLRRCGEVLGDPKIKQMAEAAEVRSHLDTINSAKASPEAKLQAKQMLVRDFPDKAKQYANQIAGLEERIAKAEKAAKRKEGVRLGMSEEDVLASSWGRPESVNRSIGTWGTHEQWVYGDGNYLYFRNGVLTSIQN